MMNYVIKELNTALRRRYTFFYIFCAIALCILANLSIIFFREFFHYAEDAGADAYNLMIYAEGVFWIPYYSSIFIAHIVFGTAYPDTRIRDKYTIGMGKTGIFFGKLITALLLGVLFLVLGIVSFISITFLFSVVQEQTLDIWTVLDFIQKVGFAVPLWIAGIAIANMCMFLFMDNKKSFFTFLLLVILIPRAMMFIAAEPIGFEPFAVVRDLILITPEFNTLQFAHTQNLGKDWLLGGVYTVLSSAIGLRAFHKMKMEY